MGPCKETIAFTAWKSRVYGTATAVGCALVVPFLNGMLSFIRYWRWIGIPVLLATCCSFTPLLYYTGMLIGEVFDGPRIARVNPASWATTARFAAPIRLTNGFSLVPSHETSRGKVTSGGRGFSAGRHRPRLLASKCAQGRACHAKRELSSPFLPPSYRRCRSPRNLLPARHANPQDADS